MNPITIIETVNKAYTLAKKAANIELQEQLMGLREQVLALQQENLELTKLNRGLEEKLSLRQSMVLEDGVYYRKTPDGSKEGPFCPVCYGQEEKLMLLIKEESLIEHSEGDSPPYRCPYCNRFF